jgi:hypothetical protein
MTDEFRKTMGLVASALALVPLCRNLTVSQKQTCSEVIPGTIE